MGDPTNQKTDELRTPGEWALPPVQTGQASSVLLAAQPATAVDAGIQTRKPGGAIGSNKASSKGRSNHNSGSNNNTHCTHNSSRTANSSYSSHSPVHGRDHHASSPSRLCSSRHPSPKGTRTQKLHTKHRALPPRPMTV